MYPGSLPTLSPADRPLVNALLELDGDLIALAERTKKPLADLTEWALRAPIQAYLGGFRYLRNLSHGLQETTRLHKACTTLSSLVESTTDPIEKRHIVSALIRACSLILRPYASIAYRERTSSDHGTRNHAAPDPEVLSEIPVGQAGIPDPRLPNEILAARLKSFRAAATTPSPTVPLDIPNYNLSPQPFDLSAPLTDLPKNKRTPSTLIASSGSPSLRDGAGGGFAGHTTPATGRQSQHSQQLTAQAPPP